MRVDFTIPSAPVPKSRPRFNTNTGRAFTDDRYIYAILAEKEYSEEACIEVSIENVEGD